MTESTGLLHTLPLPLMSAAIFLLLLATYSLSSHFRLRREMRYPTEGSTQTQEENIAGAVLGLLALLLGFTFSMAVDRFDTRRALVSQEANAISATYYLAQTFEEPYRSRLSAHLVSYVDSRVELASTSNRKAAARRLLAETEQLQRQIWTESIEAVGGVRDDISSSYLNYALETIEIAAKRTTARKTQIPRRVLVFLLIYMTISSAVMGFTFAGRSRHIATGILFVLLTMSMILIIDLDRPSGGAITESQNAMIELRSRLKVIPPRSFGNLTPVQGS